MAWINGRRVVDLRAWHSAREERAALVAERDELKRERDDLQRQLTWVLREVTELTASLRELRAAALARAQAHAELTALYRTRAIQQAEAAERDPTLRLH